VGTHAFVGVWESKCVLAFQGTNGVTSIAQDLKISNSIPWDAFTGVKVHSGFFAEYQHMKPCLISALKSQGCHKGSKIRTTGWSLGAAVSSLAMIDLSEAGWQIEESYDFGKPRVGNSAFAALFNKKFGNVAWRVTHARDPIPHLPPRSIIGQWEHVEPEAHYSGNAVDGYAWQFCTNDDVTQCSGQYTNLMRNMMHAADHFRYMNFRQGMSECADYGAIRRELIHRVSSRRFGGPRHQEGSQK
jgi:predicted lipase